MTTSIKNVGTSLITPNNYDDTNYDDTNYDDSNYDDSNYDANNYDANNYDDSNYDEVSDVTQSKSMSHGNDFYKYQMNLKNKAVEGFNGHLTQTSQSLLLKTQISTAQQQELARLQSEYVLNQTRYNSLINTILPAADNSAKLQQLTQLETTLDVLSQQINTLNKLLNKNVSSVNDQISMNSAAREEYMSDIMSNHINKANMNDIYNNVQHMLNDSDITTLQKNYSYILLSILAAATILVAMNVIKND
jgi:hypothetical protein